MGCWNETCYISKLPIFANEKIVMILVRASDYHHGTTHGCYTTDNCTQFGYPIYGKYDEYGRITDIENADEVVEYLNTVKIYNKNGNTLKITKKNLKEILGDIYSGTVFKVNNRNELDGFYVKRDLYELLIREVASRKLFGKQETAIEQFKRLLKIKIREWIEDTKGWDALRDRPDRVDIARVQPLRDEAWEITSYLKMKLFYKMDDLVIDKLTEIVMFRDALSKLRMGFFYISGTGSQSREMYIHRVVAQYVIDYTDKAFEEAEKEGYTDKRDFLCEPDSGYYEPSKNDDYGDNDDRDYE